ncbi:hypothetical protein PLICRDRAFT_57104 [Plicaturopsis crispa FD-325 SS-3]|uniref:Unplaced genomic scaffold PLICRscaffold_15, whole genome shotgun sequence n=1 Tax=Plicaturopsis crispa FD-325 SS-3 TaxID=944288 RepID=A0A0C9SRY9_PLICR|nr:hypothetical protein PLICRDRAFT_57104 [Plicaturopsis crispa FD-325 SS-3]
MEHKAHPRISLRHVRRGRVSPLFPTCFAQKTTKSIRKDRFATPFSAHNRSDMRQDGDSVRPAIVSSLSQFRSENSGSGRQIVRRRSHAPSSASPYFPGRNYHTGFFQSAYSIRALGDIRNIARGARGRTFSRRQIYALRRAFPGPPLGLEISVAVILFGDEESTPLARCHLYAP